MIDVREISERSPLHALGISIAQQAQQGLERQRRLWELREKRRTTAEVLAALDAEIAVEEHEQERNARLYELSLEQFGNAPLREEPKP